MFAMFANTKPIPCSIDVGQGKGLLICGVCLWSEPTQRPNQWVVIHRLLKHRLPAGPEHARDFGVRLVQVQVMEGSVSNHIVEGIIIKRCTVRIPDHELRRRTIQACFRNGGFSPLNKIGGNVDAVSSSTTASEHSGEIAIATTIIEYNSALQVSGFPKGLPQTSLA